MNSLKRLYALTGRKRRILVVFTFLSIIHIALGVVSMVVARRSRKRIFHDEQYMRTDEDVSPPYSDDYAPDRTP